MTYNFDPDNAAISEAFKESDIILIAWGKNNGFAARKNYVKKLLDTLLGKTVLQTSRHRTHQE